MASSDTQTKSIINEMLRLYSKREMESFKNRFEAQMNRYKTMSSGGDGGPPGKGGPNAVGSIRELHHAGWSDEDFSELIYQIKDAIRSSEDFSEDDDILLDPIKEVTKTIVTLLRPLSRNDIIDILNTIAEDLKVMEPADDEDE